MYYAQPWTEIASVVSWSKKLALKESSHTVIQHRGLIWLARRVFAEVGRLCSVCLTEPPLLSLMPCTLLGVRLSAICYRCSCPGGVFFVCRYFWLKPCGALSSFECGLGDFLWEAWQLSVLQACWCWNHDYMALWLFPPPLVIALRRTRGGKGVLVFSCFLPPFGQQSFSPVCTWLFLTHSWSSWWCSESFVGAGCQSMWRVFRWCCLYWAHLSGVAWQHRPHLCYLLSAAGWCKPLLDVLAWWFLARWAGSVCCSTLIWFVHWLLLSSHQ